MKKLIVFALMAMFATAVMAQSQEKKEAAYNLVTEGVTLFDEGKKEEALKKYNAALKLDDTYASTYYEKAYTLIELGKNKEAKKVMEKGLKKATWGNIGMNYKLMGDILDEEGNARKAVEYYWKAFDLIEQNNQSQVQALAYNMGLAYVNLAKQEPDSCDAHKNHALGCFVTSLRQQPTHAGSYYGFYSTIVAPETAPEEGGYSYALAVLGWYGFFGANHPLIGKLADMPDRWATINLTEEQLEDIGPQTRTVLESVQATAKQEPSEYGKVYDMFMNAIPKVAEKFTDEPIPMCMVQEDIYEQFLYPLYAKMIREDVFETFCHVVASRVQENYISNTNWITKNEEPVNKLIALLNDGRYFDADVIKEQNEGKVPSVTEVTSAEDAHARNEEARLACRYYLTHYLGTDEMQQTAQFIFSWSQASPDVNIPIGVGEAKWLNENTTAYLVAYLAACSLYQLEKGEKGLTEDDYVQSVANLLWYYANNMDRTGTNEELDRLLELDQSDPDALEAEVRSNYPKTEEE